jgi:hypothetical protein
LPRKKCLSAASLPHQKFMHLLPLAVVLVLVMCSWFSWWCSPSIASASGALSAGHFFQRRCRSFCCSICTLPLLLRLLLPLHLLLSLLLPLLLRLLLRLLTLLPLLHLLHLLLSLRSLRLASL